MDGNPDPLSIVSQDLVALPVAGWPDHLGGDGAALAARVHDEQHHRPSAALGVPRRLPGVRSRHATPAGRARPAWSSTGTLTDRHGGGAFDVLRRYANLGALGRVLFGWREPPVWIESQGAAYLVVNENVPNPIPSVPLVAGAGRRVGDFAVSPLAGRSLRAGRTSVLHAANEALCRCALTLVAAARAAAGVAP